MSRHSFTVVVDLLPQLGEQIDDTIEELEGALSLTAAEYGAVVGVTERRPDSVDVSEFSEPVTIDIPNAEAWRL